MNYKIIRISTNNYQNKYEKVTFSKFSNLNYSNFYNKYFESSFLYSNAFSNEMNKLGNFSKEIIFNNHFLQTKWAEEFSPNLFKIKDKENFFKKTFFEQIKYYQPNVLFFQNKPPILHSELVELRDQFRFIKLIAYHNGILLDENKFKSADIIFAANPFLESVYKKRGIDTQLCYHYFDKQILKRIKIKEKKFDLTFSGIVGKKNSAHSMRYQFLKYLAKNTKIKIVGNETVREKNFFKKIKNVIFPNLNKAKFGIDYFEFLKSSKISFNIHTNLANNNCGNMRMFEATGVGSCLLTDYFPNIKDLFVNDYEVVTYKSKEECLEKINYLLNNKNILNDISLRGQLRTLKDHTAEVRIKSINERIIKLI